LLKADFHIHSRYSMDCNTPLDAISERCQELGINCIAIADHGTAKGGLEMQKIAPFKVIVAEEILTPDGEIMGMFLKETIPSGISVYEAVQEIKAQNGLVCIPHPFDTVRQSALGARRTEEIATDIDVIESFNARCLFQNSIDRAVCFATKHHKAQSAGSDSHTIAELGNAYVEMPDFTGRDDFLQALAGGRISGRRSSPLVHFNSVWSRLQNKLNGTV
jgi:predicted metal-dependent phosphoesterase TrpH